ncbi:hypothetical protein O4H49_04315 [Kiloniella laminariae]|uniref:Uncharacterized protein n=1 Tax=Kiloniella laminariae TaxID=454162 RepID=A0ABT4LFV9_9PROT|nr:hypothetical protein [Kiloniella laminariae]MCZ4279989.1 hypothetical protein [Kiloniella laminariae]
MTYRRHILEGLLYLLFPHVGLAVWISERVSPACSGVLAATYGLLLGYLIFIDRPVFSYHLSDLILVLLTLYIALPGLFFLARSFDGEDEDDNSGY